MTCEKGHFCKIHEKGKCFHGDYDYTFCDLWGEKTFLVEEVHMICTRYHKAEMRAGGRESAALLVTDIGTIASGSKKSVPTAETVQMLIDKEQKPVKCKIELIGRTNFGKSVCVVEPVKD